MDEVDDLVLNEKPSLLYRARDELLTPVYKVRLRVRLRVTFTLTLTPNPDFNPPRRRRPRRTRASA